MKDFITYELSLELKQLGFNEPCLGSYYHAGKKLDIPAGFKYIDHGEYTVLAPSYSQAFRWFREKHDMGHSIDEDWDNGHLLGYEYVIYQQEGVTVSKTYHTYEEAELACLKELIEIVKGGNK